MIKELVTINDLIHVLDLFSKLNIKYWLDGGWGVDALYGKQTRDHRDIDIDFDAKYTDLVLNTLIKDGYNIYINELPVRAELYSNNYGYIDIHPFEINDKDSTIRQANPNGGYFEFKNEWFGYTYFLDKDIPCISLSCQLVFHSGYELRDKDYLDIKVLNSMINKKIDINKISNKYKVRLLNDNDIDSIYSLCLGNKQYFDICNEQLSKEDLLNDLHITPHNIDIKDKYYIGYYNDNNELIAILDLINNYPNSDYVLIGFFMIDINYQNKKIGTLIINELFNYLKEINKKKIRLGVIKDNIKGFNFWNNCEVKVIEEKDNGNNIVLVCEKIL